MKLGIITDTHVDTTKPTPGSVPTIDRPGFRLPGWQENSLPQWISDCNSNSVDVAVNIGDIINGGAAGAGGARSLNYQLYVDYIDGTETGTALTAEILHAYGHWDLGGDSSYDAADYAQIFDNADGIGSILPSVLTVENQWWPAVAADDTAMSYTVDTGGFRLVFLTGILAAVDMTTSGETGAGPDTKTQQEWLDDVALNTALPVIVFTHIPLRTDNGTPLGGAAAAITSLEALSIKPIVFQGHVHINNDVITEDGVRYFGCRGNLWGRTDDDITRSAHSIVEITTTSNAMNLVTLEGSGYQASFDFSDGLTSRYGMNDDSGQTDVIDDAGFADATAANNVVSVEGPVEAKAIEFNALNDEAVASAAPILDFPFTLSAWTTNTGTATEQFMLSLGADAVENRYVGLAKLANGKAALITRPIVGATKVPAGGDIDDGKWYHVAGVWNAADDRELYINGEFVDSSTVSAVLPSMDKVSIGSTADKTSSFFWGGDIDDARIYSVALTASQIEQIYKEGIANNVQYNLNNREYETDQRGRDTNEMYGDKNLLYEDFNNNQYVGV
jgi:hypothetical protein